MSDEEILLTDWDNDDFTDIDELLELDAEKLEILQGQIDDLSEVQQQGSQDDYLAQCAVWAAQLAGGKQIG